MMWGALARAAEPPACHGQAVQDRPLETSTMRSAGKDDTLVPGRTKIHWTRCVSFPWQRRWGDSPCGCGRTSVECLVVKEHPEKPVMKGTAPERAARVSRELRRTRTLVCPQTRTLYAPARAHTHTHQSRSGPHLPSARPWPSCRHLAVDKDRHTAVPHTKTHLRISKHALPAKPSPCDGRRWDWA